MKKREIVIIASILVLAFIGLVFFYFTNRDKTLVEVIYHDSETDQDRVVLTFDMMEDAYYELDVPHGKFHIEVKDGQYRAIDVDCPNQNCVNVGWVPSLGVYSPIICIPNGITIQVVN